MGASPSDAPPASSDGSDSSSGTPKRDIWVCDVCHTAKFDDFDEACRHEEECRAARAAGVDGDDDDDEEEAGKLRETSDDGAVGEDVDEGADGTDSEGGDRRIEAVRSPDSAEKRTPVAKGSKKAALIFFGPQKKRKQQSRTDAREEEDETNRPKDCTEDEALLSAESGEDVALSDSTPQSVSLTPPAKSDCTPSSDGSDSTKMDHRWVCDVCHEVSFPSYEEAVLHEKACADEHKRRAENKDTHAGKSAICADEPSEDSNESDVKEPDRVIQQVTDISDIATDPKCDTKHNADADTDEEQKSNDALAPIDGKAEGGGASPPRRSGRARTQRVLYTESYGENSGGKKKKKQKGDPLAESSRKVGAQKRKVAPAATTDAVTDEASSSSVAPPTASIFQRKTGKAAAAEKKRRRKLAKPAAAVDDADEGKSADGSGGNDTKNKSLAFIFGGAGAKKPGGKAPTSTGTPKASGKVLAEHRAAEFAARRRLEREREKERQRKREEARTERQREAQVSVDGADAASEPSAGGFFGGGGGGKKRQRDVSAATAGGVVDLTDVKASSSSKGAAVSSSSAPPAPRFPKPSHVIACESETSREDASDETSSFLEARSALQATARYPANDSAHVGEVCPPADSADYHSVLSKDQWLQKAERDGNRDDLADAFSSALTPPPVSASDGEESSLSSSSSAGGPSKKPPGVRPWPDKHCIRRIPHDVCGEGNRNAAQRLLDFIGEWRQHRREVLVRRVEARAEKARDAKRKSKKPKRKTQYKDDDIWYDCDSDFEDDEGLPNLFLLTGPAGSGKTNLVHAAAHQSECVVVEINTAEQRGGAALKRAIEECTQSDSTLAMLKRRSKDIADSPGGVYHLDEEEEDDADDESSGDEDEYDADRDEDSSRKKKAPSLALVLIDEVDNIFEDDGDAGFWPALSQLSKKAKCPILLTSNAVPPALRYNTAIRYRTAETTRPTPQECAERMVKIARAEGIMTVRKSDGNDDDMQRARLALAAELCGCDLRRIANEMQVFGRGAAMRASDSCGASAEETKDGSGGRSGAFVLPSPVITGIEIRTVPFDRHTLITIKGEHFRMPLGVDENSSGNANAGVSVRIGEEECSSFRVMDSSTILAVCPPCPIPPGVDRSGAFVAGDYTMDDCITCRHAPISVRVRTSSGLVLRSESTVCSARPQDPQEEGAKIWNVGYYFPEVEGELEKLCKKKNSERSKKRRLQNKGGRSKIDSSGFLSSSDDDFDLPSSSSNAKKSLVIEEDEDSVGDDDIARDAKVVSERAKAPSSDIKQLPDHTPEKTEPRNDDPVTILEKGANSFLEAKKLLDSVDAEVGANAGDFQEPTTNIVSDASSWTECCASPVKLDDSGGTKAADEVCAMERWAKEMERSSDAALLEESLTSMAIPALSGAARGFASELVTSGSAVVGDPMAKNLRNVNAKPPSIERLYASGWNDSSFFFGTCDCYCTQPSNKRDRRMLAQASVTQGDPLSDGCGVHSSPDAGGLPDSSSGESVENDPEATTTHLGDMFLLPHLAPPLFALPSLLRSSPVTSSRRVQDEIGALGTIARRTCERARLMLNLSLRLIPERMKASSFCFGMSDAVVEDEEVPPDFSDSFEMGNSLDRRYTLDYLPALRSMAVHEHSAEKRFAEAMKTNSEDGMPLARRTSRRRKPSREHYFDQLSKGSGRRLDGSTITGKDISADLSETKLWF